jgi:carbon storage regulator
MLVLTRRVGEEIVIAGDVRVTVVAVQGDKVRLGIVAPKEVPVHRQEVYDAIHGRTEEAPQPSATAVDKTVTQPSRDL